MKYSQLVTIYKKLETTTKRIEMTALISDFLKTVPENYISIIVLFLQGKAFPAWSDKELGIANKLIIKAISDVSGASEKTLKNTIRETGDTGLAAEKLLKNKTQSSLFTQELTINKVHENLNKISEFSGTGTTKRKLKYVEELISFANPAGAKYIVRLILEELRLGVGEGVIRDAISSAYGVDAALVERGYSLVPDMGKIATIAKLKGNSGLEDINLEPGTPMKVMLAQKIDAIENAIADFGNCAYEIKYDGIRVQIHKNENEIKLFTRRLENVTKQFPEIVKSARENINAESAIVEGEAVAIRGGPAGRKPRPFQDLSRRIKRKYGIHEMIDKIPVEINLFDLIYLDGKSLINEKFMDRRIKLTKIITQTKTFRIAEQIITDNITEADEFYKYSLSQGHEGVMVKNLDAPYKPGSRVGYMYKIKPVMETLDLVIVGATWGEGRRANWLASFLLGARDAETGKFLEIGRMGTGFTDEQFKEMTENLKPLITGEIGKEVTVKPGVVVEVAYEEIQKSPTYGSGYALRFPRLVRFRDDKGAEDADTVERVNDLTGI